MSGLKTYRNCDTIPYYNFFNASKDVRWVVVDWDGFDEIEAKKEYYSLEESLRYEFFDLLGDPKIKSTHEKQEKLRRWQSEYHFCKTVLDNYKSDMMLEHVELVSKALTPFNKAYRIDLTKNIPNQIARNRKKLNSLLFKIENLEAQLKTKTEQTRELNNVFEEVVALEEITGKDNIDPHKTSASKIAALIKKARENGTGTRD